MNAILLLLLMADPSMSGPEQVVPVGKSVWLEVSGVTVEEMQAGSIDIFPKGYLDSNGDMRILQDLRGSILIWLDIAKGNALGQYDVLVVVPRLEGKTAAVVRLEWTIKTGDGPPDPVDPIDPPDPIQAATAVTYVYEKDQNSVPSGVAAALQNLNNRSLPSNVGGGPASGGTVFVATEFEQNTTNGLGETPEQYRAALDAAKEAGLPALVVQAGDTVLRVVVDPTTEIEVMEALK